MPHESKDTTRIKLQFPLWNWQEEHSRGRSVGQLNASCFLCKIFVTVRFINFRLSLENKASCEKLGIFSSN